MASPLPHHSFSLALRKPTHIHVKTPDQTVYEHGIEFMPVQYTFQLVLHLGSFLDP